MKSIKFLLWLLVLLVATGNVYAYKHLSPYAYCAGDPVNCIDPDGKQIVVGITNIPVLGTEPIVLGRTPVIANADKIVNLGKSTTEATKTGIETTGKTSNSGQSHHIIPKQATKLDQTRTASKEGFKIDGKENRIDVPKYSKVEGTGRHANHPNYNKQMIDKISQMIEEEGGPSMAQQFRNLVEKVRQLIKESPDTKINDLKLNNSDTIAK